VIVEFNGKPIHEMEELPRVVAATPVGKKVSIVVLREGKRKSLQVKVAQLQEMETASSAPEEKERGPLAFGLRVQNLTPELAEQLGVEEEQGVVVTAVEPGSPADEANIRRGDVILEVDRSTVKDVADLRQKLSRTDQGALLLVRRGDATLFVAIKKKEKG